MVCGSRPARRHAADIDNPPALLLHHHPHRLAPAQEWAGEHDIDRALPLGQGQIDGRDVVREASIVDENVDTAIPRHGLLEKPYHLLLDRHVRRAGQRSAALLPDRSGDGFELIGRASGQNRLDPGFGKDARDRGADTGTRAGDDGDTLRHILCPHFTPRCPRAHAQLGPPQYDMRGSYPGSTHGSV